MQQFLTRWLMLKKLKSAGFKEDQVEVQAEALACLVNESLATKRDLHEFEMCLKHDLTIRLGCMMITSIVVVATLLAAIARLI